MTTSLLALTFGGAVDDIGRSLKEGLFMFYDTAWALVLGFGLSGAVQAFVSRAAMQRRLGDHRPAAIARASVYGMVSSSCSYAASAMAKSLFQKGADFIASMVFMFASTNLVVELGIVLAVLIGWQFVAAEFVGGVIMIILLAIAGGLFFRGRVLMEARRRVENGSANQHHHHEDNATRPWRERIGSLSGWSDAASYTMADLKMLRRELIVGYGVAGFLTVLVPVRVWSDIFLHGHGFSTTLENALVGPLIAIISFVCSIGNVPLAAALWTGGISFGGVVSFIFADLIAMPLLLIYRKLYGTRMAFRMLGVFWATMSISGLIVEEIFRGAGIVPTTRPRTIITEQLSWNYTTFLNIVFFVVFMIIFLLAHYRSRLGGGADFAIDPICGMQVEKANAPASYVLGETTVYFCSDRCQDQFTSDPKHSMSQQQFPQEVAERSTVRLLERPTHEHRLDQQDDGQMRSVSIDPVCQMTVDPATAESRRSYDGTEYSFCGPGCAAAFDAQPTQFLGSTTTTDAERSGPKDP